MLFRRIVDEEDHLLGVIEFDDIIDIMQEESTEDINLLGGVNSEERLDSTIEESFKSRIPWLIINLFTAVLACIEYEFLLVRGGCTILLCRKKLEFLPKYLKF